MCVRYSQVRIYEVNQQGQAAGKAAYSHEGDFFKSARGGPAA